MTSIKRPISISIISWLLICFGVITIIFFLYILKHIFELELEGMPILYTLAGMLLLISGLYFFIGIGMLKGLNWARLLYLRVIPAVLIGSFIIQGFPTKELLVFVINIIIYLIIMVLLTRPKVVAYFNQNK